VTAVLVLNAGSSSIKFKLFGPDLSEQLGGMVAEIGGAARLSFGGAERALEAVDHDAALAAVFSALEGAGVRLGDLAGVAHRVVHGGVALVAPQVLTEAVIAEIEACVPLAPLHNPPSLAAIRAVARLAPDLTQTASFDTAFHATNPEVARRYALPASIEAEGIRRYGFHGTSYASLVARWADVARCVLPARLLALHLGNGASLCAIRNGQSVATTMGYSPLSGLTMGTRAGDIDGNAVLRLVQDHGQATAADILNRQSGLLGLGGLSDMRELGAAGTDEAGFALAHFRYWAVRHAGSMIAAMGGLDGIAFTGGIGENDAAMRAGIVDGLGWLGARLDMAANAGGVGRLEAKGSAVVICVVPAEEERQIACDAFVVLADC